MYLSKDASRARLREAQNARNNRAEIVKALSQGQVTRRELMKWGIFTASGGLAMINGLSPYAYSQVLPSIPTGTPRSPLYGAVPFSHPLARLNDQKPHDLTPVAQGREVMLNGRAYRTSPIPSALRGTQSIRPAAVAPIMPTR